MLAYKGFNKDMTCRGFQFKEGETYHEDNAHLCESGFHACEDPLDCFGYYEPANSVYHEVDLDEVADEREESDSKICGKTIKIGARLDIAGICKAHIEFLKSKIDKERSVQGYGSAAISTGNYCKTETANGSISIGWGKDNFCKGEIGSYIVLIERGNWDGEKYPQIGEPKLGKIDGVTLKPDTWYKLENGEFREVEDGGKE